MRLFGRLDWSDGVEFRSDFAPADTEYLLRKPVFLTPVNGKLYFKSNDDTEDKSDSMGERDDELWVFDPSCSL